jgi:hypothetical protein
MAVTLITTSTVREPTCPRSMRETVLADTPALLATSI